MTRRSQGRRGRHLYLHQHSAEPAPVDHEDRDRVRLQRGRRRDPLHDRRDQRRQHRRWQRHRDRSERQQPGLHAGQPVVACRSARTINCTASHTITQADIDAGSFFNQACVDDGAGGAAEACDDVTTPGSQNPHLTITKVATETGYSAVGDVIHYTIVGDQRRQRDAGERDGHRRRTSATSTCTPANGSPLAPGASITCTASHTITQADIDAGSYFNQACVDDGAGGAAEACDDVTTPGSKNPHLTITKVATESGFSAVGDVIHYTITATNDGNTTLAAVTVTDPNVSDLDLHAGQRLVAGAGRVDHLHGQPHDHPGRHRRRQLLQPGLCRRRRRWRGRGVRRRHHAGRQEPAPDDHQGRDRDGLQRGRRRDPLHDRRRPTTATRRCRRDGHRSATSSDLVCTPANGLDAGPGRVDQLHGQPHDHPGRHRRRQLLQPGLCRRRCRWCGRGVRRRRPRRAARTRT